MPLIESLSGRAKEKPPHYLPLPDFKTSKGKAIAGEGVCHPLEKLPKSETLKLRKETIGSSVILFFAENPLKIVRASGQWMYDEEGNAYLDCINNVAHVGHCHPHVTQAAVNQMGLLYTNARYLHDNLVVYAKRLLSYFPKPLEVCYFVNSGSEANDLAMRLARAYTHNQDIICLDGAYHGHLSSTIDISPYKFRKIGHGETKDFVHVASIPCAYRGKFNRDNVPDPSQLGLLYAKEVKEIIDEQVLARPGGSLAAFICESMISCGGQVPLPEGYLPKVYEIVKSAGGVTIVDEVQVGFGRTGDQMWAFQAQGADFVPDIVTVGKSIGNGHPVACVITTKAISQAFANIGTEYFNTYGGNPVSAAVAAAVLDVIESESLQEHAVEVGNFILGRLRQMEPNYRVIGDVRGSGLFIGIDLVCSKTTKEPNPQAAKWAVGRFKKSKILMSTEGIFDNVLKFKPPMCFGLEDAERFLSCFEEIATEIEGNQIGLDSPSSASPSSVSDSDGDESSSVVSSEEPISSSASTASGTEDSPVIFSSSY